MHFLIIRFSPALSRSRKTYGDGVQIPSLSTYARLFILHSGVTRTVHVRRCRRLHLLPVLVARSFRVVATGLQGHRASFVHSHFLILRLPRLLSDNVATGIASLERLVNAAEQGRNQTTQEAVPMPLHLFNLHSSIPNNV